MHRWHSQPPPSMPIPYSFRSRNILPIICSLIAICSLAQAVPTQDFPPIKLRGYGTLSGQVTTNSANGQSTSVLKITCDDETKAKLVLAKYLSDLQVLPNVQTITVTGHEGAIPAYSVDTMGAILGARDSATVYVLAANSADALGKLESSDFAPNHGALVFTSDTDVPMYLNRFDKYGFRFYMAQWQTPKGQRDYDLTQEYDYAAAQDHSGMQFWADTSKVNTAEGLTNDVYWIWGAQAAREKGIPLGINTNAGFEAPVWLLNRYRDQDAQKMPGYVGCFYDTGFYNLGGPGWLSWASTTGQETLLSVLQQTVRAMSAFPNVTSYMEPHAETQHGVPDVMLEYGPTADASYRPFLQKKYASIEALNTAWQTHFASWEKVRVPELASFVGYGPEAIDLGGQWHINYEASADGIAHPINELGGLIVKGIKSSGAPDDWFSEKFDDHAWPTLTAPGDDNQTLLPRWPAVFRRSFEVPAGWIAKNPKVWLYVWDANRAQNEMVKVVLNGQVLGTNKIHGSMPHLGIFPVGTALRDGTNELAIRTPQGRINYKVYLSPDEPQKYPNLGDGKNQQWADFIDWDVWIRGDSIRKGMEMIRQVDPDRGIMLASPDTYAENIKDDAKKYGGDFHNTGYMGGWWCDRLPAWMRGVGLPMSVEPGGPAHNVTDFHVAFGNWITEGVNAVDYFLTIGDVLFNPDIKQCFEENLKIIRTIGKYHAPFAEVANVYSSRVLKLMDFPWSENGFIDDPNPYLGSAYLCGFNERDVLRNLYESDALTETSFAGGDAARYKVVVDADTAVMDDSTISAIEQYVRNGGIYVAYGQTGRHLPGKKDAWPIERLTGYKVTAPRQKHGTTLVTAENQTILPADWIDKPQCDGGTLEKVAPEAVDLLHWSSGGVAAGMRPLGKGYVIDISAFLNHDQAIKAFSLIFKWQNIAQIPAHVESTATKMQFRHFISNNGLYDVWALWNQDASNPLSADVVFADSLNPAWAICVKDGSKAPVANHRLSLKLNPFETAVYLTPRTDITAASTEWFNLQRGWWQGTTTPEMKPLPPAPHLRSVDLNADWAFKAVSDTDNVATLVGPDVDDKAWDRVPMGIWTFTPGHRDVHHAILRKTFTVPATWTKGEPTLWIRAWDGDTFRDAAQLYIDGKPCFPMANAHGPEGINPDGVFKPGTTHTVALDIKSTRSLAGSAGNAWLWYWIDPVSSINLAGKWDSSADGLSFGPPVAIPGPFVDKVVRTHVTVPSSHREQRVVINLKTLGAIHTVIINGHYIARHHHNIGEEWELDITPWIKFGGENTVEVAADGDHRVIESARLGFFKPGTF
jgi:hypothetical protein